MTQNPFDALGGGGFDMNALLQQAQQMQQQLEEAQANLAQQTVEGTVAGGAGDRTSAAATLQRFLFHALQLDSPDADDDTPATGRSVASLQATV